MVSSVSKDLAHPICTNPAEIVLILILCKLFVMLHVMHKFLYPSTGVRTSLLYRVRLGSGLVLGLIFTDANYSLRTVCESIRTSSSHECQFTLTRANLTGNLFMSLIG